MKITRHTVVSFKYSLYDAEGLELERSQPTVYLHGAHNILPRLESALEGLEAGEHVEVTLTPHEAYGERLPNQQERIPTKYLKHEGKLRPGQVVRFNTDQGLRTATVLKVGKFAVDVDLNHPLAGKTLRFVIDVENVREAKPEEIAHRHAHGPGGHQH